MTARPRSSLLALCIIATLGISSAAVAMDSSPAAAIVHGNQEAGLELAKQAMRPGISIQERDQLGRQAAELLASFTSGSDPEVAWHLGSLFAIGAGVPYSPDKALFQIGRAADLGQPTAAYWMANHYDGIHRTGIEPIFHRKVQDQDRTTAHDRHITYLVMAAQAGHVTAMNELVAYYSEGTPQRWSDGADFWRETARIHKGRIFPVEQVPYWVRAGAPVRTMQHPVAKNDQVVDPFVGHSSVMEQQVPPVPQPAPVAMGVHDDQSKELLAARLRLVEAERRIAELEAARERDRMQVLGIPSPYDFLASHGALPPMTMEDKLNRKGLDFYEGRSYQQAALAFHQASEQGSVPAQANLGLMYLHGVGIEQDTKKALKLLRSSARGGNVIAAENLGYIFANGLTGKVDIKQARRWFRRAIEHGSQVAPAALARLDAHGRK